MEDGGLLEEIYEGIAFLEDALGFLSPYAPTPPEVIDAIVSLARTVARPSDGRQLVVYEPGCGRGVAAKRLSEALGAYYVCLELDEGNAVEAREECRKSRVGHLVEVVQGDLRHFWLRRVDLVYAYLLSHAVRVLEENLRDTVIISLDYRGEREPVLEVNRSYHTLYVIRV